MSAEVAVLPSLVAALVLLGLLFVGPGLVAVALRRSFPSWLNQLLIGVCLLYAGLPLLLAMVGASLGQQWNCESMGILYTCPGERGQIVTGLYAAGMLAFITLPSGLLGVIGLLILMVGRRGRSTGTPATPLFCRQRRGKVFGGICAALASRLGWSVMLVRAGAVALTVLVGIVPLVYLWMWIAFPLDHTIE